MYSYLEDKDYFNQHYKRSLANRLLHDTTIGTEQEDQFLMMIKQRCGARPPPASPAPPAASRCAAAPLSNSS